MHNWHINTTIDLDNLNTSSVIRTYGGAVFEYGDTLAHTWNITVLRAGEPYGMAESSPTVYAQRSDEETVIVAGSVSANVISVTFPAEVYAVEGPVTCVLRAAGTDNEIVTLAVMTFNVTRDESDTYVDPGETVPDITDLLAQISAMEAATARANSAAASAESAVSLVADTYSASATYEVGDLCVYNGALYICITAITTAEAFNSAKWQATTMGARAEIMADEIADLEDASAATGATVSAIDVRLSALEDQTFASVLLLDASGPAISVTDAAKAPLQQLIIAGKSVQDGTPTFVSPVDIVPVNAVTVNSTEYPLTSFSGGINGIQLADGLEGANYTDSQGNKWICDTVNLETGTWTQRIQVDVWDGSSTDGLNVNSFGAVINASANYYTQGNTRINYVKCNRGIAVTSMDASMDGATMFSVYGSRFAFGVKQVSGAAFANVEAARAYLEEHPYIFVYALAEPVTHQLTTEQLTQINAIRTARGTCAIANNVSSDMSIIYVGDLKAYIDSLVNA